MKLSTRSRYGTKMMFDISTNAKNGPVSLSKISKRQSISVKYLEQLTVPLKKAGLIKSVRGPKGGYLLTKSSDKISVGEIVWLLESERGLASCLTNPESCDRIDKCITRDIWERATKALYKELNSISLGAMEKKI